MENDTAADRVECDLRDPTAHCPSEDSLDETEEQSIPYSQDQSNLEASESVSYKLEVNECRSWSALGKDEQG